MTDPIPALSEAAAAPRTAAAVPPQTNDLVTAANGACSLDYMQAVSLVGKRNDIVLKMLLDGRLANLDERGPGDITLLGVLATVSDASDIPGWSLWTADPAGAWRSVLPSTWFAAASGPSAPSGARGEQAAVLVRTNHVAAALMFAGADPWLSWTCVPQDTSGKGVVSPLSVFPVAASSNATNMLEAAVANGNSPLIELLLSHPNCPSASEIDRMRVRHTTYPRPQGHYYYSGQRSDIPFVHLMAARDNAVGLKRLLELGCDPNGRDAAGRTPLFFAHSPATVALLLEHKARLAVVDDDENTIESFWSSWIPTAAARASVTALLIKKMNEEMTKEEVLEHQKPVLFAVLRDGTKTEFETIYRKSKFAPDTTWNRGTKGVWSLRTIAMLRQDEKTKSFIAFLDHVRASCAHEVLPGLSDHHVALLTSASGSLSEPMRAEIARQFEGMSPIPDKTGVAPRSRALFGSLLSALPALAQTHADRFTALRCVISLLTLMDANGGGSLHTPTGQERLLTEEGALMEKTSFERGGNGYIIRPVVEGLAPKEVVAPIAVRLHRPEFANERSAFLTAALSVMNEALERLAGAMRRGNFASVEHPTFTAGDFFSERLLQSNLLKVQAMASSGPDAPLWQALLLPLAAFAIGGHERRHSPMIKAALKDVVERLQVMPIEQIDPVLAAPVKEFLSAVGNVKGNETLAEIGVLVSLIDRADLTRLAQGGTETAPATTLQRRRM